MTLLVVLLAAIAAVLSYRLLEEWGGRSWVPALCRATGWGTVVLLLANASCPAGVDRRPATVLLDASLSMQAAGGRWSEAAAAARRAGEVRLVGGAPGDTTASGGHSRLAGPIVAAQSAGRPVIVMTDGEIEDRDEIPGEVLAGTAIRVFERRPVADFALTRVEGTTRLTPSDTVRIDLEVQAFGGAPPRRLAVVLREGDRIWTRGAVDLDPGGRGRAALRTPLAGVSPGAHVLTVALADAHDSEPRDDARLLVVTVVRTPGVVLLASPPTWESRFLLETLRDVAALPVRGYLEMERGRWRREGDLRPAPMREVNEAVRRADLLVTLGTPGTGGAALLTGHARARWIWGSAGQRSGATGDWYLTVGPATPVSGAFAGLAADSFPPGTAIVDLTPGVRDWIGLSAQAGRRGASRPVLLGHDSAGVRQIVVGIEGLWRWRFQGGASEQAYRSLVAASVSWLLGGADPSAGRAHLRRDVVERGRPATFEWSGGGAPGPVEIEFTGPGTIRRDTLVFDGAGRADVYLPPGVWRYQFRRGGEGTMAVEEYSTEWLPAPRTLVVREASASGAANRVPVRTWLSLFGLAVVAFAGEWLARRRLGLR